MKQLPELDLIDAAEIPETDKYGHKAMLDAVNKQYRCPKDQTFLKWKNKEKRIAVCPKCGFEKMVE